MRLMLAVWCRGSCSAVAAPAVAAGFAAVFAAAMAWPPVDTLRLGPDQANVIVARRGGSGYRPASDRRVRLRHGGWGRCLTERLAPGASPPTSLRCFGGAIA